MQILPILAAAAGASASPNLPYLMGLLAIVLSLVAIFRVSALKREMAKSPAAPPASAAPAAAPARPAATPTAPAMEPEISPEIIAVIAAAVATVTGKTHRVVSIKPMSTSWERAGRHSVFTSHRIR